MSKYLVAVFDGIDPYIVSTSARTINEAENRIMNKLTKEWDLDVPADWCDFCNIAQASDYQIGEVCDIDEF